MKYIILLMAILIALSGVATAQTLTVGEGQDYETIQEAFWVVQE